MIGKIGDKISNRSDYPKKRVFILGAGCSADDGVPLIAGFFNKLEDARFLLMQKGIKFDSDFNLFRLNYKLDNANIEEFLSYLDLHIQLDSKFPFDPLDHSKGFFDLQKMRDELANLIGFTVEDLTKKKITGRYSEIYAKFFEKLTENDVVISLNWDVLLDTVFYNYNLIKKGLTDTPIDYGDDLYIIDIDDRKYSWIPERKGIKLLKLHGSLNWLYCPTKECGKKFFTFYPNLYGDYITGKKIKCPQCKREDLKPLIVPPTFLKRFDKEGFSSLIPIWQEAFEALQKCNEVIIVGYSFPQDDIHFKHFFRSSLSTSDIWGINESLPIKVINYKKYLNDKAEFENYYRSILEGISHPIEPEFKYMKFSKYVDGLL